MKNEVYCISCQGALTYTSPIDRNGKRYYVCQYCNIIYTIGIRAYQELLRKIACYEVTLQEALVAST